MRLLRLVTIVVTQLATTTLGCARSPAPGSSAQGSSGEMHLALDATSTSASTATDVRLVARKASIRVHPTSGAHLVEGTIRASDPTLLPHLTHSTRGIAIVQDFSPRDDEKPKLVWDLALGAQPLRLDAHVLASEEQSFDLGGLTLVAGRLYGEGGHLVVDWSAPNRAAPDLLELWAIGYLEAHHLGHSRASRVAVKGIGLTELDVGALARPMNLDVEASAGKLVITVPHDVPTTATIEMPLGAQPLAEGWVHRDAVYTLGDASTPRQLTIRVRSTAGAVELRTSR